MEEYTKPIEKNLELKNCFCRGVDVDCSHDRFFFIKLLGALGRFIVLCLSLYFVNSHSQANTICKYFKVHLLVVERFYLLVLINKYSLNVR